MGRAQAIAVAAALAGLVWASAARAEVKYADAVVSYVSGGGDEGYNHPEAALGPPERITGEGSWPGQVEPFNPPWLTGEVVSIGPAGHLVLGFNSPVLNERGDGYAADLIVFGNTFLYGDFSVWPPMCTDPAQAAAEPARIQVSQDGAAWFEVRGVFADALWPTLGYRDAACGSAVPGAVPTNVWEPMDAARTLADFDGVTFGQMVALYGSSGGGAAVDLSDAVDEAGRPAGLAWIAFVRFTVPQGETYSTEIDAVVRVPEPATLGLLGAAVAAALVRRRV